MNIDILTLFPDMFDSPLAESMVKRARENRLVSIRTVNIRDYAPGKHRQVDDYPYGGGAGMVMKVDVVDAALRQIKTEDSWVVMMSPQGKPLRQPGIKKLAQKRHLVVLCGHYEGFDARILNQVDEEISIGDYILTGGELPAMVLVDAVVRLIPGVLDEQSPIEESFGGDLLEYPQYTRPVEYEGQQVPEILLSGHHENIRLWRKKQSLLLTLLNRPDLLLQRTYDREERRLLEDILFQGRMVE